MFGKVLLGHTDKPTAVADTFADVDVNRMCHGETWRVVTIL